MASQFRSFPRVFAKGCMALFAAGLCTTENLTTFGVSSGGGFAGESGRRRGTSGGNVSMSTQSALMPPIPAGVEAVRLHLGARSRARLALKLKATWEYSHLAAFVGGAGFLAFWVGMFGGFGTGRPGFNM